MHTTQRTLYREHLLSCSAVPTEDGRFQARVAVAAIGGDRTRAQRFLDLDAFGSEEDALAHATQAGREWVDKHMAAR
jgi:hypothetical protein